VVGEVADSVQFALGEEPQPVVFLALTQDYSPAATLHVRTIGDPNSVLAAVRPVVQSLDRNLALTNVTTIQETLRQGLWAPRMGAAMLSVFGALALVLSTLGIYGVLSYSVSQQVQEIGIRMALGGTPRHVLRYVVGQGVRLALIGVALGLPCALALSHLLVSLLFGVKTMDLATFASVPLLLLAMAVLASYIPARRATGVDPMVALRYE
jgi:ABC-type antimicrobial peptide transport system permease subunit